MWKDEFLQEKRFFETANGILYLGDALTILKTFPDNSIDAVCTDPPYGLKFMNQKWDYDVPSVELWKEVLRVLKPGGHLLSFFGTRTYHRAVVNIEDAGFEIRDMIQWLYGSGFPKSMNISKAIDKELNAFDDRKILYTYEREGRSGGIMGKKVTITRQVTAAATPEAAKWEGWGTGLKPANEPIVLARKPISEKNIAQNVMRWGTGGLNIDETRIGNDSVKTHGGGGKSGTTLNWSKTERQFQGTIHNGRFPANVILDEEAAKMLDEQSGVLKSGILKIGHKRGSGISSYEGGGGIIKKNYGGDSGGASRFFYVAKAGRKERFFYCRTCDDVFPQSEYQKHKDHDIVFHPTVKPIKLVKYLIKLITPPDGIVLDPFFGSGTTAVACEQLNCRWIGIEINEEYCRIAKKRLEDTLEAK